RHDVWQTVDAAPVAADHRRTSNRQCGNAEDCHGHPWRRHRDRHKRDSPRHGGVHPATLMPSADGLGLHDFWLFEGLLPKENGRLHVTASNYNDPIATELVQNARRCISLHGCTDRQANGRIQLGGLDVELRDIVLDELTAAAIDAEITHNRMLDGSLPDNIA